MHVSWKENNEFLLIAIHLATLTFSPSSKNVCHLKQSSQLRMVKKNVNKSSQSSVNSFVMEKSSLSNWAPLLPQGDAPEFAGEHLIQPFDHDDQN